MEVELRITVLSGSRETALSSPAIYSYGENDVWVNRLSARKFGPRSNHGFKPCVIHLDHNYNSAEGHRTLSAHTSPVIVSGRKRQKQEGRSTETNASGLAADRDFFKARLINHLMRHHPPLLHVLYCCLFPRRPRGVPARQCFCTHLISADRSLSETLAEVALDVDWISAADSSFGFSSPINFARARHWSDKQHEPRRLRLRRHLPTWYRIKSARRLSLSKGLLEDVALRWRSEPTDARGLWAVLSSVPYDGTCISSGAKCTGFYNRKQKVMKCCVFFFSHRFPLYSPRPPLLCYSTNILRIYFLLEFTPEIM